MNIREHNDYIKKSTENAQPGNCKWYRNEPFGTTATLAENSESMQSQY